MPRIQVSTFKKELDHLVALGMLIPQKESEWASPTFIIPKKDGRVHWIRNLRQLNKWIKHKQCPLPIITDIPCKQKRYQFFNKLNICMQYYTFKLDAESQDLCTIIMPFGKCKYARLPMGLKCSPDIAQATMENILASIKDADVYFDDIVKDTNWLCYWLTPHGLKPWKKKTDAVLRMDRPRTSTELRQFIGCLNYFHDTWPSHAHVLEPLTDQTGLKKAHPYNDAHQHAFDKMHHHMVADALAAYPDHNKWFDVYTDASDFQLGAFIMQDDQPVVYFSRKLNKAQKKYTAMEKELLSIVATLEEFCSILLEFNIQQPQNTMCFAMAQQD
ncbi:LOW QUALITY PROTEIN: hypothetical protein ACHAW6_011228 [Cyclotella cf. meneghiniana]